jgi:phenylacetate-CoA ligase
MLTDLHNYAMPLIRYENGDAAILGTRACECGRSLPLLEKVEGRTLDMIRTRDGRLLPGEYFPHNLKDVSGLVEFQVIQESLDVVRVLVVTDNRSNHEILSVVEAVVREGVGPATQVTIEQVQRISRTPSGKRRVTVSQLPRQIS